VDFTIVGEMTAIRGYRPRKINPAPEDLAEAVQRKELAKGERNWHDPNTEPIHKMGISALV